MSIRLILVLLVFLLDVWALYRVMAEPVRRRTRLKWTLAIVLLPVFGVFLWLREARRHRRPSTAATARAQ